MRTSYLTLYRTVEQQVAALIEELKTTERAYFGKDRVKVIKGKIDEAVALLDTKPIDLGKQEWRQLCSSKQEGEGGAAVPTRAYPRLLA